MHSEKGILHWIKNFFRSQFLLDSYFNGNFFPHIWILHAEWSLISWSYSKFMIFQYVRIGKVSQIILNYQERILHLSNFFFKPDIFPWKIEGTGGIFLVLDLWCGNSGKLCIPAFQGGLRNIQTTDFQFVSRKWWKPLLWDFLSFWGSRDEKAGPVLFVFEEGLQGRRSSPFWRSNEFHKEDFLLQGKEVQRVKNPDVSFPAIRRPLLHNVAKGIRLLYHWVIGEKDYPIQTRSPDWWIPDVF